MRGEGFVDLGEFFFVGAWLGDDGFGFVLGRFEVFGLVHEQESLERGVGAFASSDAGVSGRGVKDGHLGWGEAALPEGVDGASAGLGFGTGFCGGMIQEGRPWSRGRRVEGV